MDKDFIKIFEETQALMHGHFILSSGLHSDTYFQCAKVLQYPKYLTMFGEILSNHDDPDIGYNQLIRPWKSRLALFYIENKNFIFDFEL